jgi:small subunit ribosomal protein S16
MLVIRLFRVGNKNQPLFKIVVTDKTKPPRSGRFVEEVGFYNPLTKEKKFQPERIKYWLKSGAQPSDTVYNLLVSEKIIEGKKRKIPVNKPKPKEADKAETVLPETAAKPQESPKTIEPEKAPAVSPETVIATEAKTEPAVTEPIVQEITKPEEVKDQKPAPEMPVDDKKS